MKSATNLWTLSAACPNTGRLKKRASPVERVLARICREAGARVKFNTSLRDMDVGVTSTDERNIEVMAQDLPCFAGAQLAIDVTLMSALGRNGRRRGRSRVAASQNRQRDAVFRSHDWALSFGRGCH